MSKPDRVTAALTKLLDNADPAVVATAAGKLTDLRIAKMGTEKSENKVGPLRDEIAALKKSLGIAEASLAAATAEKDALAAQVAELRAELEPIAVRVAELETFKADVDSWKAEQVRVLTAEAQQNLFKAQRSENAAKDTLATAQSQFGARGQQILLDEVKRIVEEHHIPEPEDLTKLPAGISPLYLTLWSHSPIKAQLMIGYAKSFPEPSENFTRTLLRYLKATLPLQMFAGMEPPAPIENLAEKIAVMTEQAKRWNVWTDIQQQFEAEQVRRQSEFLRYHNAQMIALQNEGALRGAGRSEIGVEEKSPTGYQGPHPPECVCGRAGCNPLPAHLRPFEVEEKF